jgi:Lar family restriction alleviation protein
MTDYRRTADFDSVEAKSAMTPPIIPEQAVLKPCPFCGRTDMWTGFMGDEDGGYGYVECRQSCAQSHEDDEEAARKAWNTRHEAQASDLNMLREALEGIREKASGAGYDPTQAVSEIDGIVDDALATLKTQEK